MLNVLLWLIYHISLFGFTVVLIASTLVGWTRLQNHNVRQRLAAKSKPKYKVTLGFFHPYCSGGGGGERVLWKMVEDLGKLVERGFSGQIVIYTVDEPGPDYAKKLVQKVKDRFDISPPEKLNIHFVHLHEQAHWLKPAPRLSLIVESYGTMRLAAAALGWHWQQLSETKDSSIIPIPDWFIDTTGCAFTFPVARLLYGCRVMAYVHYPTISTDMLQMVWERRRSAYNHDVEISSSRLKTFVKMVYYVLFAFFYGLVGSLAEVVLVNSSWTAAHIKSLWKVADWTNQIRVLYPPCRTQEGEIKMEKREPFILSIGQFRPEKDHVLQIEAFDMLLKKYPDYKGEMTLVLLGSCRGSSDESRLESLHAMVKKLGLSESVEFVVNQPYSVLQQWLNRSSIGIHTMWNEHFGIGIVEMMDAGLIVVAHNSGGPRTDIISPGKTGFLAATPEEYADSIHKALSSDEARIRHDAKESAARFSDQEFTTAFQRVVLSAKLLQP